MLNKLIKHSLLSYKRSPFKRERSYENMMKGFLLFWMLASSFSYILVFSDWLQTNYGIEKLQGIKLYLVFFPLLDLMIRYFFQSVPKLDVKPYLALNIPRKTIVSSVFLRSFLSAWFIIFLVCYLIVFIILMTLNYPVAEKIYIGLYFFGIMLLNHVINFWLKLSGKSWQNLFFGAYVLVLLSVAAQRFGLIDFIPALNQWASTVFSNGLLSAIPLLLSGGLSFLIVKQLPRFITDFKDDSVQQKTLPFQFFSKYGPVGKQIDYEILMAIRLKAVQSIILLSFVWVAYPLIIGMRLGAESTGGQMMALFMGMFVSYGVVQYGNFAFSWHTYHFDSLQANQNFTTILWGKYYFMILVALFFTMVGTVVYAFIHPWFIPYIWIGFFFNVAISTFLSLYYSIKFTKPKNPYKRSIMNSSNTDFNTETLLLSLLYFAILFVPYGVGVLIGGKEIGLVCVLLVCAVFILLRDKMMAYIVNLYEKNRYNMFDKFKNYSE